MGLLLIVGTGYEMHLLKKMERRRTMNYDLEKHAKLEQFALSTHNGKLNGKNGLYTYCERTKNE